MDRDAGLSHVVAGMRARSIPCLVLLMLGLFCIRLIRLALRTRIDNRTDHKDHLGVSASYSSRLDDSVFLPTWSR